MMRNALIAAALLALVLYGCSKGQPDEVYTMINELQGELTDLKNELVDVKTHVGNLKSELSNCKVEMQALVQKNQQEANAAAEDVLEEAAIVPEPPAAETVEVKTED